MTVCVFAEGSALAIERLRRVTSVTKALLPLIEDTPLSIKLYAVTIDNRILLTTMATKALAVPLNPLSSWYKYQLHSKTDIALLDKANLPTTKT
jgi:hypothetical protein